MSIQITKAVGLKEISLNPSILFVEMEDGSVRQFVLSGSVPGVTYIDDVLTLDDNWTELVSEQPAPQEGE